MRKEMGLSRDEALSIKDQQAKLLAEELEAEKEKRVLQLQQAAARRIGQIELSKGWNAWHDWYGSRRRCKQLLASSIARV